MTPGWIQNYFSHRGILIFAIAHSGSFSPEHKMVPKAVNEIFPLSTPEFEHGRFCAIFGQYFCRSLAQPPVGLTYILDQLRRIHVERRIEARDDICRKSIATVVLVALPA
jgi:hypothetical protein